MYVHVARYTFYSIFWFSVCLESYNSCLFSGILAPV